VAARGEPEGLGPRLGAIERLQAVLKGAQFSPIEAGEIADSRDRALANRLVTTALRRHGHIDLIIAEVLERGLPPRSGNFEAVLRIALAELLFLPGQADHSALFLAVEAVKRDRRAMHLAKLTNGVLRRVQREAARFSALPPEALFPAWIAERWTARYGAAALKLFAEALLNGAPLDLTLRDEDPELIAALKGCRTIAHSYRVMERDRSVADLPGYAEGRWWVQDMAAALPARLFGLNPGARVLDMCAAPGGKTAQLVKAGYEVTALDLDPERLKRVGTNLDRLGYRAHLETGDGASWRPARKFDGVLLDAPCTATGIFRRHPEVLWQRRQADTGARAALQRQLLANAAACLEDGGVLIYSTCSLEPEEGEDQADWAIKSISGINSSPIAAPEIDGLSAAIDGGGRVRTHPAIAVPGAGAGGMDGFFISRFRRN
jgi:16S rRNA (cytosine967-C5)-methyltransferase